MFFLNPIIFMDSCRFLFQMNTYYICCKQGKPPGAHMTQYHISLYYELKTGLQFRCFRLQETPLYILSVIQHHRKVSSMLCSTVQCGEMTNASCSKKTVLLFSQMSEYRLMSSLIQSSTICNFLKVNARKQKSTCIKIGI